MWVMISCSSWIDSFPSISALLTVLNRDPTPNYVFIARMVTADVHYEIFKEAQMTICIILITGSGPNAVTNPKAFASAQILIIMIQLLWR